MPFAPVPMLHVRIEQPPAAKVEVAHVEVGTVGKAYRLCQRRQKIPIDAVEYSRHVLVFAPSS